MSEVKVFTYSTGTTVHSLPIKDGGVGVYVSGADMKVGISIDPTHGKHNSRPPVMYEVGSEPAEYSSLVQQVLSSMGRE